MDRKGVIRQRRGMWIKPPLQKKSLIKFGNILDLTPNPLKPLKKYLKKLLTHQKRFYPLITKTKGVESKMKLLVYHASKRNSPSPTLSLLFYSYNEYKAVQPST